MITPQSYSPEKMIIIVCTSEEQDIPDASNFYEILKVKSLEGKQTQADETRNKLIQTYPELYFHTMEKTAQRLAKEALTDRRELQLLLLKV